MVWGHRWRQFGIDIWVGTSAALPTGLGTSVKSVRALEHPFPHPEIGGGGGA